MSRQYLVSVPLRMLRLWAFMGMMAQVRPAHVHSLAFAIGFVLFSYLLRAKNGCVNLESRIA